MAAIRGWKAVSRLVVVVAIVTPSRRRDRPAQPSRADPLSHRGAEIRTRDLTDPNGARYQAALRPADERPDYRTGSSPSPPPSRRAQEAAEALSRPRHAFWGATPI